MTLIKSISGIRGTIGGCPGDNLTPVDLVKFTTAYSRWLTERNPGQKLKVVIGRDARISGKMVDDIVQGTLLACGIDVINVGLCATPGVELAVTGRGADGGMIITASHNPRQWNALKLLNGKGEFISEADGNEILEFAEKYRDFAYPEIDKIGDVIDRRPFNDDHIDLVLALPEVNVKAVRSAKFKVVVDGINSVGGVVVPFLLWHMGVDVVELNCEPTGEFAHDPEPIPANLTQIREAVVREKADMGIVVDPDVDRLAFVQEDGELFGEEYTLVAIADYILSRTPGNTVSNLSSTRALRDVTESHGGKYYAAAVGEVNVVEAMKKHKAVIGGEGNGGIIFPKLHYGRDAIVGIALFLTYLAKEDKKVSELRAKYPDYYISKNKIELTPSTDVDKILESLKGKYADENITDIDGVKIDFPDEWVHLRKSNTEPIIRVYAESNSEDAADKLAARISDDIMSLM